MYNLDHFFPGWNLPLEAKKPTKMLLKSYIKKSNIAPVSRRADCELRLCMLLALLSISRTCWKMESAVLLFSGFHIRQLLVCLEMEAVFFPVQTLWHAEHACFLVALHACTPHINAWFQRGKEILFLFFLRLIFSLIYRKMCRQRGCSCLSGGKPKCAVMDYSKASCLLSNRFVNYIRFP